MLKVLISVLLLIPTVLNAETDIEKKDYTLSCHKAGHIEKGMTIEDVYKIVGKGNSKLTDLQLEGQPASAIEIYYDGIQSSNNPTIVAEISSLRHGGTVYCIDCVDRIRVYDKKFKTEKGIGVGSTLGELKKVYEVDGMSGGEGTICAIVQSICMSFVLEDPPESWWRSADLNLIPDSSVITSVLLP